jgi:sugar/nucleoside kinase (ribokinase family)
MLNIRIAADPDFEALKPLFEERSKYIMLGNLTPSIQKKVVMQMEEKPRLIAMDTMNFWMNTAWHELLEVLKMVDLLAINDEEARQLSDEQQMLKAAKKILTMGPRFLIIKRGEYGALLFSEDKMFFCPALPLERVVDPTGAGDTFAGGLMGYLAKADDLSFETLKTALVYGAVLASFTVEKFGTQRLLEITAKDVNVRLNQMQDLSSFSTRTL